MSQHLSKDSNAYYEFASFIKDARSKCEIISSKDEGTICRSSSFQKMVTQKLSYHLLKDVDLECVSASVSEKVQNAHKRYKKSGLASF